MSGESKCEDLSKLAAQRTLLLDTLNASNGAMVNVTCAFDGHSLVGESQLTCQEGNWSHQLPYCTGDDQLTERERVIIGVCTAAVGLVLIILTVVIICCWRFKVKDKLRRNDRLAATLEKLSIRDPLDELVRRESGRSSYGNPAFTSSSTDDAESERKQRQRNGVQLSRQALSTWHYQASSDPGKAMYRRSHLAESARNGIKLYKLFKIWDYTRSKKQFVFADGLDELVQKGAEKLKLSGPIRVVLEEDGTEIDNDAVLRACAGMVFLLLENSQVWTKPELVLSVHEYSNNVNHYQYDMDEKL